MMTIFYMRVPLFFARSPFFAYTLRVELVRLLDGVLLWLKLLLLLPKGRSSRILLSCMSRVLSALSALLRMLLSQLLIRMPLLRCGPFLPVSLLVSWRFKMLVKLFSIFDTRSRVYLAPFVARSVIDAQRQISASFKDAQMKDTPVGQNPEDFELHNVGDFDDETGAIAPRSNGFVCSLDTLRGSFPPASTVAS